MQELHCAIVNISFPAAHRKRGERTHEPAKPLERARNAHVWVDLDKDTLGGVDVDLEKAGFV